MRASTWSFCFVASALASAVLATFSGAAPGTFPGGNGPIVFENPNGEGWGLSDPATGIHYGTMPPGNLWPAFDPDASPDGRAFAFVRGRDVTDGTFRHFDVWTVDAEGTAGRRVVRDARSPAWSPDGSRLAVVRGAGAVWVVRADGTRLRRVPGAAARGGVLWSPGGRILYAPAEVAPGHMYSVRPDGSHPRVVIRPPRKWGPLSPDGEEVAVRDGNEIFAERLAGGSRRLLATAADPDRAALVPAAWSPDGRYLLLVEQGYVPAPLFPTSVLLVLEVASGEMRRVSGHGLVGVLWQSRCTLSGRPLGDELRGTRATDVICGLDGGDRIRGGTGVDRLFGHGGDDRIDARDGGFDVVGCGIGYDAVVVDRRDLVGVDCERVRRVEPRQDDGQQG